MASSFSTMNRQPNVDALLEQILLIQLTYQNDGPNITNVINMLGGYDQLNMVLFPTVPNISYVVWRKGTNVWIVCCGTEGNEMMEQDIIGTEGEAYPNSTVTCHSYFFSQCQYLEAEMARILPGPRRQHTWHLSSHSLGGGAGFLFCQRLAAEIGPDEVQFIGFGMPKSLTEGFTGTLPSPSCYMISTKLDPVPYLPPSGMVTRLLLNRVYVNAFIPLNWKHYARCFEYDLEANLSLQRSSRYDAIIDLARALTLYQRHYPPAYGEQIAVDQRTRGVALYPLEFFTIFNTAMGLNFRSNRFLTNGPRATINVPYINRTQFGGDATGPLSTSNFASVGGSSMQISRAAVINTSNIPVFANFSQQLGGHVAVVKGTFFFLDPALGAGWSESLVKSGSSVDPTDYQASLERVLAARLVCVPLNLQVPWVRISMQPPAKGSVLLEWPRDPWNGTMAGPAAHPDMALLLKLEDTNRSHHTIRPIRGLPARAIGDGGVLVPSVMNGPITGFVNTLKSENWGWSGQATKSVQAVTAVTQVAGSNLAQVTIAGATDPVIAAGQYVVLSISGAQGANGINGRHTYLASGATTFTSVKPISVSSYLGGGRLTYSTKSVIVPARGVMERISERRVGRAFTPYRGRQRARR